MQNSEGKVIGARCRDEINGESLDVYAKVRESGSRACPVRKKERKAAS